VGSGPVGRGGFEGGEFGIWVAGGARFFGGSSSAASGKETRRERETAGRREETVVVVVQVHAEAERRAARRGREVMSS
jgi:hypothetical protein